VTFTFRPAKRENTPLIVGIAGPTKSGKTYSAHRVAQGLANGGVVAMINAEGAKGHQYADEFNYVATDIEAPFRPERYTEVLKAALALEPAVVIVDSVSHMHDGPGGILEYQADEKARLGGGDKNNYTAWIKPKAAENQFIYALLSADCHVVLCMRAKEKIKIVGGKPVELGWQPIVGERVAFETLFTLMLPPHSKGAPDLSISEMRKPFDTLIRSGEQLTEETGAALREWASGAGAAVAPARSQNAGLSMSALKAWIADAGADKDQLAAVAKDLFPDAESFGSLTDGQRAKVRDRYLELAAV